MPTLTISEAARLCGVNRRTLQRAVQDGRLHLTEDHRVDTADLHRAGYAVSVSHLDAALVSHMDTAPTPQGAAPMSQVTPQALERLAMAIEGLGLAVDVLSARLTPQGDVAGTPQAAPHHVTPQPQETPQGAPQAVAPTPQGTPQTPATGESPASLPPYILRIAEVAAAYDKLTLVDLSQLLFDRGIYRAHDRKTKAEKPVNKGTLLKWLEQARQAGVL